MSAERSSANRRLFRKLAIVAGGSFLFAFSLVPLYRIACEKVFGIKLDQGAAPASEVRAFEVDRSRVVTVQFDANVNEGLPWSFEPRQFSMKVHPGEPSEAWFDASNTGAATVVGNAAPSVAPNTASIYFNKTECFCFTEQLLAAGETRAMPVRFVIDPELPESISTLTLSYTFFLNDVATRREALAAAPAARDARVASSP